MKTTRSDEVTLHIRHIKPARRVSDRWRQYELEKSYLLDLVAPTQHDAVIRALTNRLNL
ncbi:hypothetical protein SDC9_65051 [bioreactor metagenome]|uniref:Uncharacterized protein n=1 Tax=bioreactor metagenome TaxID=1076179 RepID=A0A644XSC0_9ZZZZ